MKKRSQLLPYYPAFLNIYNKRCVVVGGGRVALRKVRTLLEHRANVLVISPDLCSELGQLAKSGKIRVINRNYRAGDLRGAFVSIAATDNSTTNQNVVKEAQRNAILVNVVDSSQNSTFILPSYIRRGDITIVISTAGMSPALSRKICTRLKREFGDEYASLALLTYKVRSELKRQGIKIDGDSWQEALDLDLLLNLIVRGDDERAMAVLISNLKKQ